MYIIHIMRNNITIANEFALRPPVSILQLPYQQQTTTKPWNVSRTFSVVSFVVFSPRINNTQRIFIFI